MGLVRGHYFFTHVVYKLTGLCVIPNVLYPAKKLIEWNASNFGKPHCSPYFLNLLLTIVSGSLGIFSNQLPYFAR